MIPGKGNNTVHYDNRKKLRKKLGKSKGPDPAVSKQISVISADEKEQANTVSSRNKKIVTKPDICNPCQLSISEQHPENIKK